MAETVGETGSFSPVWGVYIQLLASLYSQKIPKLQKRPPPRFFHRVRVDGPLGIVGPEAALITKESPNDTGCPLQGHI